MEIKKILFPTDFSAGSEYALPYALDLSRRYGSRLYVLHVIYDIEKDLNWYAARVSMEEFYREMEENAKKELDRLAREQLIAMEDVEQVVLKGLPYEEIIQFLKENSIDLVVMATHSRKGLDRVLFGSTASKVVRHSPCPVLTVRIPHKT